jgi:hypothetical protein
MACFSVGSTRNRIGGLDSNESGLNRRINLQLLSGQPQQLRNWVTGHHSVLPTVSEAPTRFLRFAHYRTLSMYSL